MTESTIQMHFSSCCLIYRSLQWLQLNYSQYLFFCQSAQEMDPSLIDPNALYYSHEIKKLKQNSQQYHHKLKHFLSTFKIHPCPSLSQHSIETCFYYHDQTDMRRNPYQNHQFLYNVFEICPCSQTDCIRIHNQYQSLYHPLLYKINPCQNGSMCEFGFFCYYSHPDDLFHFQYGEFFRFDLRTFKTQKCYKKNHHHERKTCLYYHNDKDKRRPSTISHSHFFCDKQKCTNELCQFSHNKLEQLYHPNRYKTKFCQFYPKNIEKCDYKSFCSFAHTEDEIIENIELIHLLEKTTEFYLYKYKTVWCPFTQNHQRDKCVYAHNIQDFRRNPKEYAYEPEKCQFWNFSDEIKSIEETGCKLGMDCKRCHGWMEQRYHPSKYPAKKNKSLKKQDLEAAQNIVNLKMQTFNLSTDYKPKGKGNTNPQILKSTYTKGTPFFKNDKSSEYSVKTKAKSSNFESDKSVDGSSTKGQAKTINQKEVLPALSILSNSHDFLEGVNWQSQIDFKLNEQSHGMKEPNSARSKSAQKSSEYAATYSNSIRDALQDTDIIIKLQKQKFNEIQILNMDESKIEKLSFLSSQQKQHLSKKLKIYNFRAMNAIKYSIELTKYFVSKKKEAILQKMQAKRVKEAKLLKLAAKEINDLSFLEAQEKVALPKLLKEYMNNKEFNELNERIEEATKMK